MGSYRIFPSECKGTDNFERRRSNVEGRGKGKVKASGPGEAALRLRSGQASERSAAARIPEAAAAVEGTWPLPEQRAAARRYAEELKQAEEARKALRK